MPDIVDLPELDETPPKTPKLSAFCLAIDPCWGYTTDEMMLEAAKVSKRIGIDVYAMIPINAEGVINTAETYHNDPIYNHSSGQFLFQPTDADDMASVYAKLKGVRDKALTEYHLKDLNTDVKN